MSVNSLFPGQTLRIGREYSVTIPLDKQVRFSIGWCTLTEDLLEPNLEQIQFVLAIDGSNYAHLLQENYYTREDSTTPTGLKYCFGVTGVVSGWESGRTYRIEFGFTILSEVDDGWDVYPPGDVTHTYIITSE